MTCNKCIDILVGLSYGSEGKGKYMSVLQDVPYKALVRTGSSNAAHSVVFNNKTYVYHIIPCGAMHFPNAKFVIGAAAQLDINHLKHEIQTLKDLGFWSEDRLMIDPNAVVVENIDKVAENGGRMPDCGDLYFHPIDCDKHTELGGSCEKCDKLPKDSAWKALGSTTHGCGANLIRKVIRGTKIAVLPGQELDLELYFRTKTEGTYDEIVSQIMEIIEDGPITDWSEFIKPEPVKYADEFDFLRPYIGDTVGYLNSLIDNNEPVLLEGTQGALLSLHHGYRRKTTSRDTNAANWCADAGISPLAVRDVYGVTRTFPIRVAGNSGPTSGQEITWEEVTEFAGYPEPLVEITTATKRKRRVFTFGEEDFKKAININRPTKLMLSFVDYLSYKDRHKTSWDDLTQQTKDWITTLESKIGVFFNYLSTGPAPEHTIIRKSPGELIASIQAK